MQLIKDMNAMEIEWEVRRAELQREQASVYTRAQQRCSNVEVSIYKSLK